MDAREGDYKYKSQYVGRLLSPNPTSVTQCIPIAICSFLVFPPCEARRTVAVRQPHNVIMFTPGLAGRASRLAASSHGPGRREARPILFPKYLDIGHTFPHTQVDKTHRTHNWDRTQITGGLKKEEEEALLILTLHHNQRVDVFSLHKKIIHIDIPPTRYMLAAISALPECYNQRKP